MYAYVWRDGVTLIYAIEERMREGDEYLDELKNSINLPVHSRPRDIRRALSWRYASCDRRDMLILCGAFITRGVGVFYFHEVLRPVNTFDRRKVVEIFFNGRPRSNSDRNSLKRLLLMHNQLLKHPSLERRDQCSDFGISLCAKSLKSSTC